MNYQLETRAGDEFTRTAKNAKEISIKHKRTVEFEFNGILCLVSHETNLEWLWRDYKNAHRMDWQSVGAKCVEKYPAYIQKELEKRNKQAEIESKKSQEYYEAKEKKQRNDVAKKIKGIEIELKDKDGWEKGKEANKDHYGAAAYEFAEVWARLMQVEIGKGIAVKECAEKCSHEADYMGITGFMYGCAVGVLSAVWKYGEDLRVWHNKEYGHEGKGVVNPSVLTISAP